MARRKRTTAPKTVTPVETELETTNVPSPEDTLKKEDIAPVEEAEKPAPVKKAEAPKANPVKQVEPVKAVHSDIHDIAVKYLQTFNQSSAEVNRTTFLRMMRMLYSKPTPANLLTMLEIFVEHNAEVAESQFHAAVSTLNLPGEMPSRISFLYTIISMLADRRRGRAGKHADISPNRIREYLFNPKLSDLLIRAFEVKM